MILPQQKQHKLQPNKNSRGTFPTSSKCIGGELTLLARTLIPLSCFKPRSGSIYCIRNNRNSSQTETAAEPSQPPPNVSEENYFVGEDANAAELFQATFGIDLLH